MPFELNIESDRYTELKKIEPIVFVLFTLRFGIHNQSFPYILIESSKGLKKKPPRNLKIKTKGL
ncbi:hypothetical protein ACVWYG_003919 [Pedobacter sp. UYEF25]